MSKRPAPSAEARQPKKQRHEENGLPTGEALDELLRQADSLVSCLRAWQKQSSPDSRDEQRSEASPARNQLSRLSRDLIPSLQALASEDGNGTTPATVGSAIEAPKPAGEPGHEDAPATLRSPRPSPHPSIAPREPVRGLLVASSWVSSEIPPKLPPLPKVSRRELEDAAFIHPGLGTGGPSYERLEWLGDAFIELIATALIDRTFPRLPAGRCSQIREQLVRNVNLAQYFRAYGMPARARLPPELLDGGRGPGRGRSKDKDLVKTQADMFEAFVAAVILSDPEKGLVNVMAWLKDLWGGTIRDDIRKAEGPQLLPPPAKVVMDPSTGASASPPKERLATAIGAKGVRIRYEGMPNNKKTNLGQLYFTVGVMLDGWGENGKLLGVGTAMGKKEAGHKAAAMALENKKLIRVYEEKKRAFLEAQAAAQAAQEAGPQGTGEATAP